VAQSDLEPGVVEIEPPTAFDRCAQRLVCLPVEANDPTAARRSRS
jgi:hypothetical protein